MKKITFIQTRNIYDYSPLLDGLFDDFGYAFQETILEWCGVLTCENKETFQQIYVVKLGNKVIGTCGLYSYFYDTIEELWLGWFALIPKYRNKNLGVDMIQFVEAKAKEVGCKKILSFVYKEGTPLNFYFRNGYKRVGTVKTYVKNNSHMDRDYFESLSDIIIAKEII